MSTVPEILTSAAAVADDDAASPAGPNAEGEINPELAAVIIPRFSDSPNARSKTITMERGQDTHGMLNRHLENNSAFQIGVHHDKGARRTMEDAYSFVVDFAGVRGQGYFAVFDGHAGKYAAEWCGGHFHEHLLVCLHKYADHPIPDILNYTFHSVDAALSAFAAKDDKMHSGCTAVTAFLRIEDEEGKQSYLPDNHYDLLLADLESIPRSDSPVDDGTNADTSSRSSSPGGSPSSTERIKNGAKKRGSKILSAIKGLTAPGQPVINPSSPRSSSPIPRAPPASISKREAIAPPNSANVRRVLYTANVGDARGVLCRGGKAVRLTYDHKGSDKQEAKRITDAGGFVMGGRVNGVLAVTRSLGDSSMKEFVVGAPYTTETQLGDDDEFLILACDGLWDVANDQQAVDLVRELKDPQEMASALVDFALKESTDNITAVVVRFSPGSASAQVGRAHS